MTVYMHVRSVHVRRMGRVGRLVVMLWQTHRQRGWKMVWMELDDNDDVQTRGKTGDGGVRQTRDTLRRERARGVGGDWACGGRYVRRRRLDQVQ